MRNKYRTSVCLTAALIICIGLTATASAATLWEQQQGDNWAAFPSATYFSRLVADDFNLQAGASIASVSWAGGAQTPAVVNGFYVRFYNNSVSPEIPPDLDDGTPGTPAVDNHRPGDKVYDQYIPIGSVLVSIPLGGSTSWFNYQVNLPISFGAAAETQYWFSVQANTGVYDYYNPDTGTAQPWWSWLGSQTRNLDPGVINGDPRYGKRLEW